MQKLLPVVLLFLLSACHKEFTTTNPSNRNALQSALKTYVPATLINELDWNSMEEIADGDVVMGYNIPLRFHSQTEHSFILVTFDRGEMVDVFKNDIEYTDLHGGKYPVAITNHSFVSAKTAKFNTNPGDRANRGGASADKEGENEMWEKLPPVTMSGIFKRMPDNSEQLTSINTYVLGVMLGMGPGRQWAAMDAGKRPHMVHYYNPLGSKGTGGGQSPLIQWELSRGNE
jgi:hypothetical protein